ncbi:protein kinase [Actinoplanes sp. TRM 88003]|uniref:non-specific serine/threonine protein kinase n=1 Tax=Paractinoplanes aksuensis TaxID=2939490 RepID=A0ABT1DF18_9ACTN|nr:serine/threonine protein kinase [Actinoplanes aksuensis]MCO8269424.1 protein kinase [Actinoplanes aksuensis]
MDGSTASASPGADLAGRLLGDRYELLTPIGAGGTAVVWRARDHVLARVVAVKIVATEAGDHRIRQEAQAAAGLSHPNIAQVHDYGELRAEGRLFPYVVMELVEGGTLSQRLAAGPLTPRSAVRVCAEIAAALAAAHAAGLVHRDIKPANVMLGPTGAKVVDFGIAAATAPAGTGDLDPEVLGTPAYLAPERLLDDSVEPASDVYALGVVLYRLLTGHSPWTIENTTQMLTNHIYVKPAPLPPVPGVPGYVTDLGERCLRKDPARRPSAREAATLLSQAAAAPEASRPPGSDLAAVEWPGSGPAAVEPPGSGPSALERPRSGPAAVGPPGYGPAASESEGSKCRRRRPLLVGAAAASVLVVGAAGWWLLGDDELPSGAAPATASSAPRPGLSTAPAPGSPSAPTSGEVAAVPGRTRVAPPAATTAPATRTSSPATTATAPPPPATVVPPAPKRPTAEPGDPSVRSFSSAAGTATAACPSSRTAEILAYVPRKPYKVESADEGPSAAAIVTFKHGNRTTTMTVTCEAGEPTVSVTSV